VFLWYVLGEGDVVGMDETGRIAGTGVGDQGIKPGDWKLEAHVIHKNML